MNYLCSVRLLLPLILLTSCIGVAPYRKPAAAPLSAEQIVEKFNADGELTDYHNALREIVGHWRGEYRRTLAQGVPTETAKMSALGTSIYGGRFTWLEYDTGSIQGEMIIGYENTSHNYVLTRLDSASTQIQTYRGSYHPTTRTFEFYGGYQTPLTGDRTDIKLVITRSDARIDIETFEKDLVTKELFKSLEFHLESLKSRHGEPLQQ